jgi:acetylornithine deacetylase/succinyl-diaminopimelate desuccinylase-like protein
MDKRTDKDLELIRRTIDNSQFRESLESLLIDILSVDTSPEQQLEELSRCENLVFNKISEYLDSLTNLKGSRSRHPIADNIEEHPFYSKIFPFPDRQETPADIVYAGRNNLIYSCRPVHEKRGRNVGLNAHIDVVSPYFPPSRNDLHIKGRGSTDDKGNVVAILGALKVLDELIGNGNVELSSSVLAMFVIDEEIGGNGSLSLAMDHDLKKENFDSLLIMECASNNIFPGNRGAVFVKIDGAVSSELIASKACNVSVILETYSFGLVSLIDEGLKIKRESFHEQFPQNPVYTCTGILGNFGKHPSGICDYIEFSYRCSTKGVASIVEEAIQKGLAIYIDIFGDKRNTLDSLTGLPKILTHYEIRV